MDSLEQKIRKTFIKNGLLLGGILLALSIFSFYFITTISKSPVLFVAGPIIFTLVIPIIVVVIICYYGRKKIGGYWTFKQATTGIFIMFLIGYAIQIIGRDLIFAKLVEPHMIEKTEVAFMDASAAIRKQPGVNQQQIDKNVQDIRKNFDNEKNGTIGKTVQDIVISILFIFVLALIFAALFKREAPLYAPGIDDGVNS